MLVNNFGQKRKDVKLDIEYFKSQDLDQNFSLSCSLPWGASVLLVPKNVIFTHALSHFFIQFPVDE